MDRKKALKAIDEFERAIIETALPARADLAQRPFVVSVDEQPGDSMGELIITVTDIERAIRKFKRSDAAVKSGLARLLDAEVEE